MKLRQLKPFARQYTKLPPAVRKKVDRQLINLNHDIRHPGLRAQKMVNRDDIWEARVDEHYRFTFQIRDNFIILRKVGTHQIYRKP